MSEYKQFYVPFDRFNDLCLLNPYYGAQWEAAPEELRRKYHEFLHEQVEAHPWCGRALGSPSQPWQFPRIVPSWDGEICIRWGGDIDRYYDHYQQDLNDLGVREVVLPETAFSDAAIDMFRKEPVKDLVRNRDVGAVAASAGPVNYEFPGRQPGVDLFDEDPLPKPLWRVLAKYSLENEADIGVIRFERG